MAGMICHNVQTRRQTATQASLDYNRANRHVSLASSSLGYVNLENPLRDF